MTQIHWANPVSAHFDTAADWTGGIAPGATDDAILDAVGGAFTVSTRASETVNSVQLAANATLIIGGGTIFGATIGVGGNAGVIQIDNGADFVVGSVLANTGIIKLDAGLKITTLMLHGDTTLSGGGSILLDNNRHNQILGAAKGVRLTNIDNTITGAGALGAGRMTLVNQTKGVIDATGAGKGDQLFLDTSGEISTNAGLIEATGKAGLVISGSRIDSTGTGGTILAANGSMVSLTGYTSILGGTLATNGTGAINAYTHVNLVGRTPIYKSTLINAGLVNIVNGNTVILSGAITNNGTIKIDGAGADTRILSLDVTLSGGGQVLMSDDSVNRLEGYGRGFLPIVNVDNTISGAGRLGDGQTLLTNESKGVIDATARNNALIVNTLGQTLVNAGLLEGTGAAGLTIQTTTVNNGGGTIAAGPGSNVSLQGATVLGGMLTTTGTGTIQAIDRAGVLDGAASTITNAGRLNILNNEFLSAQGALDNTAVISLQAGGSDTRLRVENLGVTLSGRGQVTMSDNGYNTIDGLSSNATLTNVDNTISGAGDLGHGQLKLVNQAAGVIDATGANILIIDTGANTIANAGLIEAEGGGGASIQSVVANTGVLAAAEGNLTVLGAVGGTGSAQIDGGNLTFGSSFNQNVAFTGTTGVLSLSQSRSFTAQISGFSRAGGTSLDLRDIGFVNSSEATFTGAAASGVLTVTDGVHTAQIILIGNYTGSTFVASSDGQGGVSIIDPRPAPSVFARPMAGAAPVTIRASNGSQIHWTTAVSADFNTNADWTGGNVPGPADGVVLDATGVPFTVSTSTDESVNSLQLAANATLAIGDGTTFTAVGGTGGGMNAGLIELGPFTTFLVGGMLTNTGSITLSGEKAALMFNSNVTLSGGGTITMAMTRRNQILGARNAIFTNVDNTIAGAGYLNAQVVNEAGGVIDATGVKKRDHSNSLTLESGAMVNGGLMEGTGSGGLVIFNTAIRNAGGTIFAGTGSVVVLEEADIIGGTLATAGTGAVETIVAATIDGTVSTVDNTGVLLIGGLTTLKGTIANTGSIEENGLGAQIVVDPAGLVLSGGGQVVLSDSADNTIVGYAATARLTNLSTIAGAGRLGGGQMTLVNQAGGVIDATGTVNELIVNTFGATAVNAGLMEGTGGAGLTLESTVIDNRSGVILAAAGSNVSLQSSDIVGGTLAAAGTGVIQVIDRGAMLDGTGPALTLSGRLNILNNDILSARGAVINIGSVNLQSGGGDTRLQVESAGLTLSGGGQVMMSDNPNNTIDGLSSGATLVNLDNTISGAGRVGGRLLTLDNQAAGVMDATGFNPLILDSGANTITNAGAVVSSGAGGLTIRSPLLNTGTLAADGGRLTVNGAVTGQGGYDEIDGGTLDFTSSFEQNVTFSGTGALELAQSQIYTAAVTGFSKVGGTSLDLRDIGFVNSSEATFSGTTTSGVLTVTDGAHTAHITLIGDYIGSTFTASEDGHGGVKIVDPRKSAGASAAIDRFIAVMAGFGARAAGPIQLVDDGWGGQMHVLVAPGRRIV